MAPRAVLLAVWAAWSITSMGVECVPISGPGSPSPLEYPPGHMTSAFCADVVDLGVGNDAEVMSAPCALQAGSDCLRAPQVLLAVSHGDGCLDRYDKATCSSAHRDGKCDAAAIKSRCARTCGTCHPVLGESTEPKKDPLQAQLDKEIAEEEAEEKRQEKGARQGHGQGADEVIAGMKAIAEDKDMAEARRLWKEKKKKQSEENKVQEDVTKEVDAEISAEQKREDPTRNDHDAVDAQMSILRQDLEDETGKTADEVADMQLRRSAKNDAGEARARAVEAAKRHLNQAVLALKTSQQQLLAAETAAAQKEREASERDAEAQQAALARTKDSGELVKAEESAEQQVQSLTPEMQKLVERLQQARASETDLKSETDQATSKEQADKDKTAAAISGKEAEEREQEEEADRLEGQYGSTLSKLQAAQRTAEKKAARSHADADFSKLAAAQAEKEAQVVKVLKLTDEDALTSLKEQRNAASAALKKAKGELSIDGNDARRKANAARADYSLQLDSQSRLLKKDADEQKSDRMAYRQAEKQAEEDKESLKAFERKNEKRDEAAQDLVVKAQRTELTAKEKADEVALRLANVNGQEKAAQQNESDLEAMDRKRTTDEATAAQDGSVAQRDARAAKHLNRLAAKRLNALKQNRGKLMGSMNAQMEEEDEETALEARDEALVEGINLTSAKRPQRHKRLKEGLRMRAMEALVALKTAQRRQDEETKRAEVTKKHGEDMLHGQEAIIAVYANRSAVIQEKQRAVNDEVAQLTDALGTTMDMVAELSSKVKSAVDANLNPSKIHSLQSIQLSATHESMEQQKRLEFAKQRQALADSQTRDAVKLLKLAEDEGKAMIVEVHNRDAAQRNKLAALKLRIHDVTKRQEVAQTALNLELGRNITEEENEDVLDAEVRGNNLEVIQAQTVQAKVEYAAILAALKDAKARVANMTEEDAVAVADTALNAGLLRVQDAQKAVRAALAEDASDAKLMELQLVVLNATNATKLLSKALEDARASEQSFEEREAQREVENATKALSVGLIVVQTENKKIRHAIENNATEKEIARMNTAIVEDASEAKSLLKDLDSKKAELEEIKSNRVPHTPEAKEAQARLEQAHKALTVGLQAVKEEGDNLKMAMARNMSTEYITAIMNKLGEATRHAAALQASAAVCKAELQVFSSNEEPLTAEERDKLIEVSRTTGLVTGSMLAIQARQRKLSEAITSKKGTIAPNSTDLLAIQQGVADGLQHVQILTKSLKDQMASLKQIRAHPEKYSKLMKGGAVTEAEVLAAKAVLDKLTVHAAAAKAKFSTMRAKLKVAKAQAEIARAKTMTRVNKRVYASSNEAFKAAFHAAADALLANAKEIITMQPGEKTERMKKELLEALAALKKEVRNPGTVEEVTLAKAIITAEESAKRVKHDHVLISLIGGDVTAPSESEITDEINSIDKTATEVETAAVEAEKEQEKVVDFVSLMVEKDKANMKPETMTAMKNVQHLAEDREALAREDAAVAEAVKQVEESSAALAREKITVTMTTQAATKTASAALKNYTNAVATAAAESAASQTELNLIQQRKKTAESKERLKLARTELVELQSKLEGKADNNSLAVYQLLAQINRHQRMKADLEAGAQDAITSLETLRKMHENELKTWKANQGLAGQDTAEEVKEQMEAQADLSAAMATAKLGKAKFRNLMDADQKAAKLAMNNVKYTMDREAEAQKVVDKTDDLIAEKAVSITTAEKRAQEEEGNVEVLGKFVNAVETQLMKLVTVKNDEYSAQKIVQKLEDEKVQAAMIAKKAAKEVDEEKEHGQARLQAYSDRTEVSQREAQELAAALAKLKGRAERSTDVKEKLELLEEVQVAEQKYKHAEQRVEATKQAESDTKNYTETVLATAIEAYRAKQDALKAVEDKLNKAHEDTTKAEAAVQNTTASRDEAEAKLDSEESNMRAGLPPTKEGVKQLSLVVVRVKQRKLQLASAKQKFDEGQRLLKEKQAAYEDAEKKLSAQHLLWKAFNTEQAGIPLTTEVLNLKREQEAQARRALEDISNEKHAMYIQSEDELSEEEVATDRAVRKAKFDRVRAARKNQAAQSEVDVANARAGSASAKVELVLTELSQADKLFEEKNAAATAEHNAEYVKLQKAMGEEDLLSKAIDQLTAEEGVSKEGANSRSIVLGALLAESKAHQEWVAMNANWNDESLKLVKLKSAHASEKIAQEAKATSDAAAIAAAEARLMAQQRNVGRAKHAQTVVESTAKSMGDSLNAILNMVNKLKAAVEEGGKKVEKAELEYAEASTGGSNATAAQEMATRTMKEAKDELKHTKDLYATALLRVLVDEPVSGESEIDKSQVIADLRASLKIAEQASEAATERADNASTAAQHAATEASTGMADVQAQIDATKLAEQLAQSAVSDEEEVKEQYNNAKLIHDKAVAKEQRYKDILIEAQGVVKAEESTMEENDLEFDSMEDHMKVVMNTRELALDLYTEAEKQHDVSDAYLKPMLNVTHKYNFSEPAVTREQVRGLVLSAQNLVKLATAKRDEATEAKYKATAQFSTLTDSLTEKEKELYSAKVAVQHATNVQWSSAKLIAEEVKRMDKSLKALKEAKGHVRGERIRSQVGSVTEALKQATEDMNSFEKVVQGSTVPAA